MFLDAEKQRAENSAAREGHIADRLIGDRMNALGQARARVEVLTPAQLSMFLEGIDWRAPRRSWAPEAAG